VRVNIDRAAIDRIVEEAVRPGAHEAAKFMAKEQRETTTSRRLRKAVRFRSGKDARGYYARAGMIGVDQGSAAWFWYFHEYQTGKGPPGTPFLRPSLFNNTRKIVRMMTGGGRVI
jgi:hypothetical protein